MKYKVIKRCLWNKRTWDEGDEADLDPATNPPKHFVPLKDFVAPAASKVHDPMKPMPMSFGQPVKMKTGFAAKLDESTQAMVQHTPILKILRRPGRPKK